MLSAEEIKKYKRQIKLNGFGASSQEKLKSAKVLLVGLGGLGSPVALYLAAAGLGTLGLVEFDNIDTSNLSRQILFTEDEVGYNKLEIASAKLKRINSNLNTLLFKEKLNIENAFAILKDFDLIIDGTDNFDTRYLINDTCVKLNLPLVHGSVSGFEGSVSLFNSNSSSPCYRCLYPIIPDDGRGCTEMGVLGTVTGIIGVQMAHECIKFITGCGETLDGRILLFRKNNFETFNLNKDPECPACGVGNLIKKNKSFKELSLSEFKKIKNNPLIVDIRESYEFEEKNIGGINLPYSSFSIQKLMNFKDEDIIIVCFTGEKSKLVVDVLLKNNFQKIYNLKGGIREAILD